MHRSKEQIETSIRNFLKDLHEIAMRDKIISTDEQRLLDQIGHEFTNLHDQLVQVLESSLSDNEFNDLLCDMLDDILANAMKVAMADERITEDERALLDRLQKFSLPEEH